MPAAGRLRQVGINFSICATQGDSFDELLSNIYEAVEGCLSVDVQDIPVSGKDKVMEITV